MGLEGGRKISKQMDVMDGRGRSQDKVASSDEFMVFSSFLFLFFKLTR